MVLTPLRQALGDTFTQPYFRQRKNIPRRIVSAIKPYVYKRLIYRLHRHTQKNGVNDTQRRVSHTDSDSDFRIWKIIPPRRVTAIKPHVC